MRFSRFTLLFFGAAILVFLAFFAYFYACGEIHWATVESPCGKYRAEFYAYRYGYWEYCAPGGGSDKPGCVYLKEVDGKEILRAELPMMSMGALDWYLWNEERGVEIRCIFDVVLEPQRRIKYQ